MLKGSQIRCGPRKPPTLRRGKAGWEMGLLPSLVVLYAASWASAFGFSQTEVAILTFLAHGVKLTFSSL